jgi:pimeloyl-ACP methyl ester carboxylesterase
MTLHVESASRPQLNNRQAAMPRRKFTDIFRRDIRAKEAANATASNRPILSQNNDASEDPISRPLPDIENLGLRVVHDLIKESVLLDIVFVHGLTGDSSSTWLHSSSERTHGREVHWPRDLVKCDVSNARISMFGYDANVASFWGGASQNRLSNHAENLLGELTGLREETGTENRYVIFVAHSLGGLVVKKALQLSESSAEKHLRRLQENTAGILFLGTPHSGSDFAPFAKSVGACLRLIGKRVNTDILDTLRRDSQVLLDVEDWFGQWLRRCAEASKSLQITCFYEELALPLIGKVVEEHQAKLTGYSAYGIHANHMVDNTQL